MRALGILLVLAALSCAPATADADSEADACGRIAGAAAIEACHQELGSLTEQIRKAPNDASLAEKRARFYVRMGDLKHALADLDRMIALQPSESAYLLRSSLQVISRNPAAEISDANQALRINPRSADAHAYIGTAYFWKNDADRAIAEFTRAIALDPKLAGLYTARAAAYISKSDKVSAEADCQRALALMPKRDGDMGYDGKGMIVKCHPESAAN